MAEVTSGNNLTVIHHPGGAKVKIVVVLDETEADALAHIFETYGRLMPELNELAEALVSA